MVILDSQRDVDKDPQINPAALRGSIARECGLRISLASSAINGRLCLLLFLLRIIIIIIMVLEIPINEGTIQLPQYLNAPEGAAWPTSTIELDASERLIVWALRRWVRGLRQNDGTQWTLVWREFGRQFSDHDGTLALAGFVRLIDGLQRHARRTVRLHQACCPCLSADEICLVGLIAACQSPEPAIARARAEWMVHPDGVGSLLEAGTQLADIMQRHGLTLPWRTETDIEGRGDAGPERALQTVH